MAEIYVSTDVETDGPIPGPHSMLSFASAAYLEDKTCIATFTANLDLLPDALGDPRTMAFWAQNPEPWNATRTDLEDPEKAMRRYVAWLKALPGRPVFVAYPAGFDFLFVYWYLIRFAGESRFRILRSISRAMRWRCSKPSTVSRRSATCRAAGSIHCPTPTLPSTTPSSRELCSAICWPRIGR
jgi:hypothetical protein